MTPRQTRSSWTGEQRLGKLARAFRWLHQPNAAPDDPEAFRGRVVAAIMLVNFATAGAAAVGAYLVEGGFTRLVALVSVVSALNLAAILVARTRWYRIAAVYMLVSLPGAIAGSVLARPDLSTFLQAIAWLTIGVALSGFIFRPRITFVVAAAYLVIPPVLCVAIGQPLTVIVGLELFLVAASFSMMFHHWVVRRSEFLSANLKLAAREQEIARQRAELALDEQSERLRITLESIGDAVVATDAAGNVAWMNPEAERLTSCDVATARGKPFHHVVRLVDGATGAPVEDAAGRTQRDEVQIQWPTDTALESGDGQQRPVTASATPIRDRYGERVGAVFVIRDESARRQLEQQLRQSQKLQAVGQLAGGIAHDFNNLLFTVSATAELIELRAGAQTPFARELSDIRKTVRRGASLTRQLLAFSRKQTLDFKLVDLNQVVADLAKMFERLLGEEIELDIVTDKNLASVRADRHQIEHALMNLVVNARDAMPTGGTLRIETASVAPGEARGVAPAHAARAHVALSVADTGHGMDESLQARIFEPFFTTKETGKGSGLGLAMVYGIATQHDGHLHVSSQPGKGSTFTLYLPALEEDPDAADTSISTVLVRGAGEKVLVVEDADEARGRIVEALVMAGYVVYEARDADEALARFRQVQGAVDVLISDVRLPGLSGPALYATLSGAHPELRVLFISGDAGGVELKSTAAGTPDPVLIKPFSMRELTERLRAVVIAQG